ncbi:MAG: transglutaminase family protein [Verrucomicrobia bacterium]|nr:transglutaminase family protein [Verrucomicrobiota bacterium]
MKTEAIARLLRDNDPATVALLRDQLLEDPEAHAPPLRELLAQTDDAVVTRHLRSLLSAMDARAAAEEMNLTCQFFAEEGDIEPALLLLGRCFGTERAAQEAGPQLDEWGRELTARLASTTDDETRVSVLAGLLGGELGFRGNADDYYAPENSLLPLVLETRLGIPISLTVVYQLVGRRAGLRIDGVNLPGHFIARLGDVLFDPFHGGRRLTASDCEMLLRRQGLRLDARHLQVATPRRVLMRSLANLHFIFEESGRQVERDRVAGWLQKLER